MHFGDCGRCGGLIPTEQKSCPNCRWIPSLGWRTAAAVTAFLALEACDFIAQPAYGIPCVKDAGPTDGLACVRCDDVQADGGLVANNPAIGSSCPKVFDGGSDGGTDGGVDGGADGG